MDEREFDEMCRRAGGRSDNLLSGQPRCRLGNSKVILENQSYGRDRVKFRHRSRPVDLETHTDRVSVDNGTITMEDGNGWEGDEYWEDATAEIRDGEIEIIDALGGRPPRSV